MKQYVAIQRKSSENHYVILSNFARSYMATFIYGVHDCMAVKQKSLQKLIFKET